MFISEESRGQSRQSIQDTKSVWILWNVTVSVVQVYVEERGILVDGLRPKQVYVQEDICVPLESWEEDIQSYVRLFRRSYVYDFYIYYNTRSHRANFINEFFESGDTEYHAKIS